MAKAKATKEIKTARESKAGKTPAIPPTDFAELPPEQNATWQEKVAATTAAAAKVTPQPVDFGAQSEVDKLIAKDATFIDVGAAMTNDLPEPTNNNEPEGNGLQQRAKDRPGFDQKANDADVARAKAQAKQYRKNMADANAEELEAEAAAKRAARKAPK